jgi:zinc/manganese transport system substrate-binding protein
MAAQRNVLTFLLLAALGLLTHASSSARAQDRVPVVATFSILGDIVRQVGGDRVSVSELVGPNQDAHVFQPSPADARRIRDAKVVFANGLGFEPYLDRLIAASGARSKPVLVSAGIKPIKAEGGHGHGHSHGHAHGANDPHAWQSVANVKSYVANIAAALTDADPAGKDAYARQAAAYVAQLDELDRDIRSAIAAIPQERRVVVTTHDAFGYFASGYGVEFKAIQGISTDAEPSAADLARIIRQVKARKAPAVFLENVSDPRKMERIARETGARVGGTLFSDALSAADGPAPSYIALMRHNIRELSKALAP